MRQSYRDNSKQGLRHYMTLLVVASGQAISSTGKDRESSLSIITGTYLFNLEDEWLKKTILSAPLLLHTIVPFSAKNKHSVAPFETIVFAKTKPTIESFKTAVHKIHLF